MRTMCGPVREEFDLLAISSLESGFDGSVAIERRGRDGSN
jgi:hypothetical protein